ncbi:MAG: hypothetical protein ACYSSP_08610 [Planctomycetota bacterium]|jgi:hypothetical protein
MAKWNIDAWIGNIAFGLAMVIILGGITLFLIFGGLFMYEYSSPLTGVIAALCIIALYILFFINGLCSFRPVGNGWWSFTKGLVSFIVLILLTPLVVKMLGTTMERMYGSVNRYFYMVRDVLYVITIAVIIMPSAGVIIKFWRKRKSKRASEL